jgi:hypothetical protein
MEKIPEYVKGNILPTESLNLLQITSFITPPITSNPPRLLLTEELFSKKSSMVENAVSARVLLRLPVPNQKDIDELKIRAEEAKQNGYISFIYPVSADATLQLPFWVLEFWGSRIRKSSLDDCSSVDPIKGRGTGTEIPRATTVEGPCGTTEEELFSQGSRTIMFREMACLKSYGPLRSCTPGSTTFSRN